MSTNQSTNTPDGVMAPVCEAIDAVIRGFCVRIGNEIIKEVHTVTTRDGIVTEQSKMLRSFDVDDLLNGRYEPTYFSGWDDYIKNGIKEFSIIENDRWEKFRSMAVKTSTAASSDGD